MRKMLAATALGATIVLGGPQLAANAAPSQTPAPVATATATAAPTATDTTTATATATSSETVHTETTTTVTHKDKTGLWGLLGLLGLAGLIPRKQKHETVVRPAHTETRVAARPVDTHTKVTTDRVSTDGAHASRTDKLRGEADHLRDEVRDDLHKRGTDGKNI